jgi:hypothetical protein
MKSLLRLLAASLMPLAALSAAPSVKVTASAAIRIALIDMETRGDDTYKLEEAFSARFEEAAAQIYGAQTPVEFVRMGPEMAADGLRRGIYDAALVFATKLPNTIRRSGFHALRAVSDSEKGGDVAYLILRREQPSLDVLLANAFNVALNHQDVRRILTDRRSAPLLANR